MLVLGGEAEAKLVAAEHGCRGGVAQRPRRLRAPQQRLVGCSAAGSPAQAALGQHTRPLRVLEGRAKRLDRH